MVLTSIRALHLSSLYRRRRPGYAAAMRYKLLGKSGLRVSELALGTMTFGEDWGFGASREESKKQFDTYAGLGGNFIDSAVNYTNGSSEKLVGEFIAGDRAHFVVATKYSLSTRPDDPNAGGNQRKNMVRSLEASLKRLGTDYIDLYWVHLYDAFTPVEETMRALDDLVRAGKVLYVGISDAPAWIVSQANTLADLRGWSRFVGLQVHWSLIERDVERDLVPMAEAFDLGITPWGVLGAGLLSGKWAGGQAPDDTRRAGWNANRLSEKNFAIAAEVQKIAAELDRSPSQIAVAWVKQKSRSVVPILGARKHEQLVDTLKAADLTLSAEHMKRLDGVSAIQLGFPHDFLASDQIRGLAYGTTYALTDDHRRR
jgi:aryl-alcohol dehydrogenase-like predicted oxidoreductase